MSQGAKNNRGMGSVYQPTYVDPKTGFRKTSAVWWISYYQHGRKCRESSGSTNRIDAVKFLKRRITEIGKGRLIGPDAEKTTFDDLAQILVNDYAANALSSLDRVESALSHLREYFRKSLALEVTNDRVAAYVARRKKECAQNATINRELSALKRALRLAHVATKVAVVPHIKLLAENNARKGFFEREQLEAVLRAWPTRRVRSWDVTADDVTAALRVAYITGWRLRSEILSRQKHHVDLEAGWLRLEPGETKNGEGRMFPLTPELRAVLEEQLQRTHEFEKATGQIVPWLFHRNGRPLGSFRKTWISACKAAGVPGRIPHDFRRTAVRNLERAGVPRSAAMAMVGHKTQAIYSRYAIADEAMLREGATKLAALHQAEQRPGAALDDRRVVPFPKTER